MGITRGLKATALAATILLVGLAVAACGGNNDGNGSGGDSKDLVPQRANLVGSVDIDRLLEAVDMDRDEIFESLSAEMLDGPEGIDEFFDLDQDRAIALFGDVKRADIFAEIEGEEDPEYFGVVLHGTFDETALISEIESLSGMDLEQESYKGTNIYSGVEDDEEFTLSVLDTGTFAVGSAGAIKDIIDLRAGDADSASGGLIDVFNELSDGFFGFAARVPQDSFGGDDLGSIPGIGDLPISLDFLSSLDVVGLGGTLDNDSLDLEISMDFTDQEAAETLSGFIDSIVTLASGFAPDPTTAGLLSGLEVDQSGSRLTITIGIPQSDLSDIFGDLTTITDSTTSGLGGRPPGTPEIKIMLVPSGLGEDVAVMPSANHVPEDQRVDYSTTPPTSGEHWGRWAECGWYPDGLPDEVITHNLEHGNIVVSYNFTNPAQVSDLRQALERVNQFESWGVARSYDNIPVGQVAVAAWGRLATFEGVAEAEIGMFFEAFAGLLGRERVAC